MTKEESRMWCKRFWDWLECGRRKVRIVTKEWYEWMAELRIRCQDMDDNEFERFLHWICLDNSHTVRSLRLARDPLYSLRFNQLENCLVFWDAEKAVQKTKERKSWTHGPCPRCDERPAKEKDSLCLDCNDLLHERWELVQQHSAQIHRGVLNDTKQDVWWLSTDGSWENSDLRGYGKSNRDIAEYLLDEPDIYLQFLTFFGGPNGQ